MFFKSKKCVLPDLRECKKCLDIVPLHMMYTFSHRSMKFGFSKICQNCANVHGGRAKDQAMDELAKQFELSVEDLPIGKIKK